MTEDQGAQVKTKAKRLRIEHYFLPSHLVHKDYNYSLVKPDPCVSFVSLALQDYNTDDEPATVQYLDIEAGRWAMPYLLIKLLQ